MAITSAQRTLIRVNIGDRGADNFTDVEIDAVFDASASNINLTSCRLLRSLASEAAQLQSIGMGKVSQSANANALQTQAQKFEDLAAADGLDVNGNEIAYDEVVEIAHTEFSADEIATNNTTKQNLGVD